MTQAWDQGGVSCIVRRNRSLGFGGASSRARKFAYSSGLTMKIDRSSNSSSAALRAAPRMKSVRVLPLDFAARSISPRSAAGMRRFKVSLLGRLARLVSMGFMIFSSNVVILIRRNANVITTEVVSGNNSIAAAKVDTIG